MGGFSASAKERLAAYCTNRGLDLSNRLGFGKDGEVWLSSRGSAIKVHERLHTYIREQSVYARLRVVGLDEVVGHTIPTIVASDDAMGVIEMTTVEPPFVLDFASAQIDQPFDFPEDVMTEWFAEKREQFGDDWPRAVAVLRALERMGIYMTDVHPGNIKFR